jgi:hypothetical protein
MNPTYVRAESAVQPIAVIPGRDSIIATAIVLFIALLVLISLNGQRPPALVPATAPPLEFSAGRAMTRLEVIAKEPHPMGSIEHASVRDFLLKELAAEGLNPEVQKTTGVNPVWKGEFRAGTVENVIARLPGLANTKAIMLVAHYDSVPNGYGASDDGAGVAALLETVRALKSGPVLKNDVIFLFTDGEEPGLLGAYAFVTEHEWAKDVGLVLNFEARGNHGPAIMFETSNQNGWLIREFARSAPYPVAHSLAYEIYRLLPNDTDLTVFKKANLPSLNFAYINGLAHYHTKLDSVDAVDQRSLQHHGSYALALARHFGNLDLRNRLEGNAVYFDLLGSTILHYPSAWVIPLSVLTSFVFVGLLIAGLRRKRLATSGLLWGVLALLSSLIVAPAVVTLLWRLILRFKDVAGVRGQGEAYESSLYFISFVALTLAITSAIYIFFRARAGIENLMAGGLIIWLIALWLASILLPGASYLPTWLLLFSLPALGYMLLAKEPELRSVKFAVLLFLSAAPALILLFPVVYQTYVGLTLNLIGGVTVMLVLLLGLLVPHLTLVATPRRWLPVAAMLPIFVGFLGAAIFASEYDAQQPRMNTMLYALNSDTGKSIWATPDGRPDPWTFGFFKGGKLERGPLPEFFGAGSSRPFVAVQSPSITFAAPQIDLLGDSAKDGLRSLRFRITSPRQATVLSVYLDSVAEIQSVFVNGKSLVSNRALPSNPASTAWNLRYHAAPAEGIELALDLKTSEPVKLRVVDQSYGLPSLPDKPVAPRPDGLIPSTYPFTDSILVSKSFIF